MRIQCSFVLAVSVFLPFFFSAQSAKILALFPFQAKSHYSVYEPLLRRLAEKGHKIVAISHFPQKQPHPNFTDIDMSTTLPSLVNSLSMSVLDNLTIWSHIQYLIKHAGVDICDPLLSHPRVKEIIQSAEAFDVFMVEIFATDCFLGMPHALKIPNVVGAISSVALPWANEILRSPENPSYIPNWFSPYADKMTFLQRLFNTIALVVSKTAYRVLSDEASYRIAKKHFGEDLPQLDELRSRIGLIFTNGHPTVSTLRSLAPGLKEIGGIHIPSDGPPPLDENLQQYLDSQHEHGVIYFSLGSQIDTSTMPDSVLAILYRAFKRLPQQILCKCNGEMPALPRNVKCIDWVPQLSVLCHPNVRLFITHGGLLGTQEAVYCAVPILGIPLFGDQHLNMAYYVQQGIALQLDFHQLTYEQVLFSMDELLMNNSYAQAVQKVSVRFKDRIISPLDEAVYWLEYLIRHGPYSLRSEAQNLQWYQYYLIDVALTIIIVPLLIIYTIYAFYKLSFTRRRSRRFVIKKKRT